MDEGLLGCLVAAAAQFVHSAALPATTGDQSVPNWWCSQSALMRILDILGDVVILNFCRGAIVT
jgi:hypothetical protein